MKLNHELLAPVRRPRLIVAAAAVAGLAAASFALHPPATHAAQAKGAVVSTAKKTSLGPIIVNSNGRTLYLFEKDRIFAYLNLSDAELHLYDQYYALLAEDIPIPDLVIYLQAKPETLKKRIAKKNVAMEDRISDEYVEEVVRAYEHFFFHYKSSDLLVIETSEIDSVDRNEDLQELLRRLSQPVKGTQYFLPLGSASAD